MENKLFAIRKQMKRGLFHQNICLLYYKEFNELRRSKSFHAAVNQNIKTP